jgi:basic membrane protein A
MRKPLWLAVVASAAIVVSACTGGTASPSAASPGAATPEATAAASAEPPVAATEWKVASHTDVGSIDDRNFNQYAYAGATDGAKAIGAPVPVPYIVPKDPSEVPRGLQLLIDAGQNIIVVNGFNAVPEVTRFARNNPDVWFIGVDHDICIDANGVPDSDFGGPGQGGACVGSADWAKLLPNYIGLNYQEDQVGYLAGIAAAMATKSNVIGAVGGITLCGPCVRYMQGYELGAKSVNPNVQVKVAWVSESDFVKAFYDPAGGKTFTQQFIKQNPGMDVVFQVAGATGNGAIDAACEAGIFAIGVDVDQHESYPAGAPRLITSATKGLQKSVSDSVEAIAAGTAVGGKQIFNAANDGVGYAPFYEAQSKLPAGVQGAMDAAFEAMKAGTLETCPAAPVCGQVPAPPIGD